MDKNEKQQILKPLPDWLESMISSPEFLYAEGDFMTKLEQVFYYQVGDLQFPARLLLFHYWEILWEYSNHYQNA